MKKFPFKIFFVFIVIALFFFYPIFKKNIPFPGDLLIGEYTPYSSYSYLGYAPGGYPNKGQAFDVIRLIYPGKEFSISQLKAGQIPLWNPYNFSGNPHLASMQSGSFYPINLLFFIFPFITAWTFYIVIQTILAAFFTYLLLREYKLSKISSVFGGIVFAYSSYMTVWIEFGNLGHSFLWLPLIIYLLHRNIIKPTALLSIEISTVLSLTILAGYIQTSMYVFVFSFAYSLYAIFFLEKKESLKNILLTFTIFILPLLLSAVQLFPTIELFTHSTRIPYTKEAFMGLLIPFYHIITIIIPDFFGNPATRNYWLNGTYIERVSYIGVMPLFFAIFALLKRPSKLILFYAISSLIVFILVFDTFVTRFLYSIYIPPIISTGVPTRMMYLLCFSLSVLAAFGIEEFEKSVHKKKTVLLSIFLLVLIIFIWWFVLLAPKLFSGQEFAKNLLISKRNLIVPSAILVVGIVGLFFGTFFRKYKKFVLTFIICLTLFDLFYFFQKITPFVPIETVYPKTEVLDHLRQIQGINRSWGYGSGVIETNLQEHEKIFGTDIYDALHLNTYGALIASGKNGKIKYPLPRSEATIPGGYGTEDLKNNPFRKRLLDLLGVKYILNKTDIINADANVATFPEKDYTLVWKKGVWQIYQNKNALPRIYFVSSYIRETNSDKIISKLMEENFNIHEQIVLEEDLENISLQKDQYATINLIAYTPNKVTIKTKSATQMLLVLSDNYYPGWKAFVDGKEAKTYRVNYSFRGVVVQAGAHVVQFSYKPESFYFGVAISAATFISMILYLIYLYSYRKRGKK